MTESSKASAAQSIEQLQQRYQALHTRKIQAETNLENSQQRLAALKKEALETYGTDDVAVLREKLAEMKAENESKRSSYQAQLEKIEQDLQAVEQKFAPGGDSANEGK